MIRAGKNIQKNREGKGEFIWEDLERCHRELEFEEANNGYVFKTLKNGLEMRELRCRDWCYSVKSER